MDDRSLLRCFAGREAETGLRLTGEMEILEGRERRGRQWASTMTQYVGGPETHIAAPKLTVAETMAYYDRVIDGGTVVDRRTYSATILEQMGLTRPEILETPVVALSDGEQRRLNLGVHLLASPALCLLDEPTSGQDSTTALVLISILRDLAKRGFNIVVTVHQPRPAIFDQFDNILILQLGGAMGYFGTPAGLANVVDGAVAFKGTTDLADLAIASIDDVARWQSSSKTDDLRRHFDDDGILLKEEHLGKHLAADDDDREPPSKTTTKKKWMTSTTLQALRVVALQLARFVYGMPTAVVVGYQVTVTMLALLLTTMFNDLPLKSNVDGGQYLYVMFISMNFLCGVSNFQFNALVSAEIKFEFLSSAT